MRGFGWTLTVLGFFGALGSFLIKVDVDTPGGLSEGVYNIGLLSLREMTLNIALACFLGGLVLVAAAAIVEAVQPPKPPQP